MADLSLDILAEVVKTCTAGAQEAAAAFGRGLDMEVQLSVGEPGTVNMEALPEGLLGPGLAVVLTVGSTGALVLLPESSGALPSWYGDPDSTGRSKLATLAQEMGVTILPEQYMPSDFKASKLERLGDALVRGAVSNGAAMLPLELRHGEGTAATAYLVFPAANPAAILGKQAARPKEERRPLPSAAVPDCPAEPTAPANKPATLRDLPNYTRSLLRITLPVVVTLARKREPLGRVVELGPGSIIQFDKSCEEMLELDVGGRSIATGEAVKVGDKFGLRISSMILPEERFAPVRKAQPGP